MGGSKSSTQKTTSVTTSTSIGDIGFTGDQAIQLASSIDANATDRTEISANLLRDIASIGTEFSRMQVEGAASASNAILSSGQSAARDILNATSNDNQGELLKALPWVAAALVGITATVVAIK